MKRWLREFVVTVGRVEAAHFQHYPTSVTDTTPHRPELSFDLRIPGKRRRKAIQVITEALVTHRGNAVWAARELGVPHRTVLRWCDRHPELKAARTRAQRGITTQVMHRQGDETVIAKGPQNE